MTPDPSSTSPHRVKIGFFSKFFGLFEPHGLLLDGLIATLYRSHFEVFLLAVARNDGKPLHHTIVTAITNPYGFANRNYSSDPLSYGKSNRIVEIPLFHATAIEEVLALGLDIIVYADTMSEPMGHFLAQVSPAYDPIPTFSVPLTPIRLTLIRLTPMPQTRLATLQLAFWGNPITSGSPSIDYFLSADMLEHPYRTRLQSDGEPYTEQVALLDGQVGLLSTLFPLELKLLLHNSYPLPLPVPPPIRVSGTPLRSLSIRTWPSPTSSTPPPSLLLRSRCQSSDWAISTTATHFCSSVPSQSSRSTLCSTR